MQQMCVCMEGGGDEASVCVCLCECMFMCINSVGGLVCKTYQCVEQRGKIQQTFNDNNLLHYTYQHHTLIRPSLYTRVVQLQI